MQGKLIIYLLVIILIIIIGIILVQHVTVPKNSTMANPASQNCLDKGGQLQIETGPKGEYGVCVFTDNLQCEEWAMFRGDCPVGGVKITGYISKQGTYCAIVGGNYTESNDNCAFKNQVCPALELYNGECSFN